MSGEWGKLAFQSARISKSAHAAIHWADLFQNIWLAQWAPALDAKRYSPAFWEKWVHAMYFGRVYYWLEGLTVACYAFEPSFVRVPASTWYGKGGNRITAGGYSRRSKRHRHAVRMGTFNLSTDFTAMDRDW